jgi:hypothetical protein
MYWPHYGCFLCPFERNEGSHHTTSATCTLGLKMVNPDSILEAVRAVCIEEGNDTPPWGCRVALQA